MIRHYRDACGEHRPMYGAALLGSPNAPLPLTRREAVAKAAELAEAGMSYAAIAIAMDVYHGWPLHRNAWSVAVRKWHGVPRRREGVAR